MTEIKRYGHVHLGGGEHCLMPVGDGDWIKYEDHAAIVASLNEKLSRYTMSAGQYDQRRSESDAVRVALGFAADANDVSPSDLLEKIAALNERVQALAAERDDINRDAEISMQLIERMEKQVTGYQAELSRRDSSVKGEVEPMNTGQLKFSLMCWQSDYDSVHDREQYDMFGTAINAINLLEAAQKRIAELEANARIGQQARDGLLARAIEAEEELARRDALEPPESSLPH